MAKKTTAAAPKNKSKAVAPDAAATSKPVRETKPRASAVPPSTKAAKAPKPSATTTDVTNDMIAERAYHLWKAGTPGDELHHWTRAERELRGK